MIIQSDAIDFESSLENDVWNVDNSLNVDIDVIRRRSITETESGP